MFWGDSVIVNRHIYGEAGGCRRKASAATEPQTFTGDVNGDERSDIILSRNIDGKRALTVYCGKTDGSFMEPITTQSTRNFFYDDPAFVGDFNGDGLTDVLIHWSKNGYRQLLVYISRGDGTFYQGVNLESTRYHNSTQFPCAFLVADVNGDGRDDFIVKWKKDDNNCFLTYTGTLSGTFNSAVRIVPSVAVPYYNEK